jgi:uncharacterized membrane protein
MLNLRMPAIFVMIALLASLTGCYNTYQVPQDEFRKLQSGTALREDGKLSGTVTEDELTRLESRGENEVVTVSSMKSDKVAVSRDTRLYVRTTGGRRIQITPFNFSMATSQLVASDRDQIRPLTDISTYEVDHFSTGKTTAIITTAVVAAVGFIVVLFKVSGNKTVN